MRLQRIEKHERYSRVDGGGWWEHAPAGTPGQDRGALPVETLGFFEPRAKLFVPALAVARQFNEKKAKLRDALTRLIV